MLLGKVVAADSENERRRFRRLGNTKDRAGQELAVRLGRRSAFKLACRSGESLLASDLRLGPEWYWTYRAGVDKDGRAAATAGNKPVALTGLVLLVSVPTQTVEKQTR